MAFHWWRSGVASMVGRVWWWPAQGGMVVLHTVGKRQWWPGHSWEVCIVAAPPSVCCRHLLLHLSQLLNHLATFLQHSAISSNVLQLQSKLFALTSHSLFADHATQRICPLTSFDFNTIHGLWALLVCCSIVFDSCRQTYLLLWLVTWQKCNGQCQQCSTF